MRTSEMFTHIGMIKEKTKHAKSVEYYTASKKQELCELYGNIECFHEMLSKKNEGG